MTSRNIRAINAATTSNADEYYFTVSGACGNTETITIGGVVFTTLTTLAGSPGEILLGANQAATLTNLTAAINDPETTTSTYTALSSEDAHKIRDIMKLTATTTTTVMTIKSGIKYAIVVSDTETNGEWTMSGISDPIPWDENTTKISLQCSATGISSGNGVFTVDVSNDGTNWTAYNRLTSNITNAVTEMDTRVSSLTVNSNAASVVMFPVGDVFAFFRVKCAITTDGAYTCWVYIA